MSKKRLLKFGLIGLLIGLIILMAGFVIWASIPPAPLLAEVDQALISDTAVTVSESPWLIFEPKTAYDTAFIFYPGGKVPPQAYAPALKAIAEAGYLGIIVPMPLNLAVFNPYAANDVIQAYPDVKHWAIGGHSLGGAMAATFADQEPYPVEGIVFWAAYPAEANRLDDLTDLAVTSIYATNDGLANPEKIEANRPFLPPQTEWVAIEGGNHAQFAWYEFQEGDGVASISREEQQAQTIAATLALLARFDADNN